MYSQEVQPLHIKRKMLKLIVVFSLKMQPKKDFLQYSNEFILEFPFIIYLKGNAIYQNDNMKE